MARPTKPLRRHTDAEHLALTNQVISLLNEMMDAGYDRDFVSSAATAGGAAFAAFNLTADGCAPTQADLDRIGHQYAGRMRDFILERGLPWAEKPRDVAH